MHEAVERQYARQRYGGPLLPLVVWGLLAALLAPYTVGAEPTPLQATVTATMTSNRPATTNPNAVITRIPLSPQSPGARFVDPAFGSTLRRIADTSADGGFETHEYSQLQAFSADNVYLLLDGSAGFVIRRVDDFRQVSEVDTSGWNAPRWQPALHHTIVHYDSNEDTTVRVRYTNVDSGQTTTHFTLPSSYQRIRSSRSFDELSHNGRWMAGMADLDDGQRMIFALDLQHRSLGAELLLETLYAGPCAPDPIWGILEPDWIGVSPLGNYLVVQWERDGYERCSGLENFDIQSGAFIGRIYEGHQHGDLGVDTDGVTEFFMTFEIAAPPPDNNFPAIGVRMLPGTNRASEPIYIQVTGWFQSHISCQGPYGVCLVTMGTDDDPDWSPLEGELFLQYVDGRIERLAHHRSSSCGYWVQPRASLARDGSYAIFASDWGQETGIDSCSDGNELGRGDAYLIEVQSPTAPVPTATASSTSTMFATSTATATSTDTPAAATAIPTAFPSRTKPVPTQTATPVPAPTATVEGQDQNFLPNIRRASAELATTLTSVIGHTH